MKVEYTAGDSFEFQDRLDALAKQYSKESLFPFNTRFGRPDMMFLIEFVGIGGVLVDILNKEMQRGIVQLLFIGKAHRKQGYGRGIVNAASAIMASRGGLLTGAYLDIGDPDDFWKAIGFKTEATVNMTKALICESTDICFPNARSEPITFASISEYLLKNHPQA